MITKEDLTIKGRRKLFYITRKKLNKRDAEERFFFGFSSRLGEILRNKGVTHFQVYVTSCGKLWLKPISINDLDSVSSMNPIPFAVKYGNRSQEGPEASPVIYCNIMLNASVIEAIGKDRLDSLAFSQYIPTVKDVKGEAGLLIDLALPYARFDTAKAMRASAITRRQKAVAAMKGATKEQLQQIWSKADNDKEEVAERVAVGDNEAIRHVRMTTRDTRFDDCHSAFRVKEPATGTANQNGRTTEVVVFDRDGIDTVCLWVDNATEPIIRILKTDKLKISVAIDSGQSAEASKTIKRILSMALTKFAANSCELYKLKLS